MELVVQRGDITTVEVDAIVNAANSTLLGGGGVDGAIHRAGGPEILEATKALRATELPDGLPTGDAVATTAGKLPARWVIHTVGPVYAKSKDRRHLLISCYRRSLEVADELGATSVAFPTISAGVYGWPHDDAVAVAVDTVRSMASKISVATVVFVPFSEDMEQLYNAHLAK
ncbi:O-acetyl-ADP-ribose deacetylase [Enteractinococcus coprophilus]|uniref:O-acetyl-ADP-ribose deacetylase (Regulator of RNase III) n=1 Tax=Enteractinococcus coprophilus TaxID=1027633 RepID=A0A543AMD8_9MICC|nr:O-acetyl-ADP-ribose deacetylase [Enteractinococcus coprophilus]TQL73731.1 O-acetyl-ADP-ribose deacetylase (regulator of RNase III) [Enteractinococcus coprophilus]